jgi:uncharacterized protein
MKETRELRFFQSLRAEDGGQSSDPQMTLRGMAATYGTVSKDLGGFREVIKPGAFTKVLATNPDVRCLFNHDANRVLGRCSNGTLQLRETNEGLAFRCQLDPNQQNHRDLHASVKRGDIDACSFAFKLESGDDDFDTATDEEGRSYNRRTISNFSHVYDVSVVTHPAYEGTSVGARALSPTARQALSFEEQIFRRTGKEYVDPQRLAARQAVQMRADLIIARANEILLREALELAARNDCSTSALKRQLARIEARDVSADGPGFNAPRCVGGSVTATREDHEKAAVAHSVLAGRCTDSKSAARHYDAMTAHRLAAENNLQQEYASAAIRSCRDAFDDQDDPDEGEDNA